MLFVDTSRNERRQEQQNQEQPVAAKPDSEEMLLESKQVIAELKPPPKAKETVINGAQVRDSYSSINQEAALVERVIRENGPDNGVSSGEMMAEVTLAKNYVIDSGNRDVVDTQASPELPAWQAGLENYLKNSQATARGIPLDQMIPNAQGLDIASRLSNASPQAQAISQAHGIQIPVELEIPMIQAIAQSQDRLAFGQPRAAVSPPLPSRTVQSTFDRIRNFAQFGIANDSVATMAYPEAEAIHSLSL